MALYARPSWQLTRQIAADAFVVVWAVGWGIAAQAVRNAIDAVADPARAVSAGLRALSTNLDQAAEAAGRVPIAGEQLGSPLSGGAGEVDRLVATAEQQITLIEQVATLSGLVIFLMPVLMVLAMWLPARWAFHRRSAAAQRFIDSSADLDLFALRAMSTAPMAKLATISDDPVRAWRQGDQEVIDQLADLELRRCGLRFPDLSAKRLESTGEGG